MKLPYGPPNKSLLRELRQVSADAEAVVRALREVNLLPDTFPRIVLEDLCKSLAGLKDGTAENCRPTLEYVRNKIPEIRRENFHVEGEEAEDAEAETDEPLLYRGMVLDRQLNLLLASVTTALDEYRVQSQERFDDEVRGEEVVALNHPAETKEPVAIASDVIKNSEGVRAELISKGIDRSEKGEILARRLQDSRNLAFAALSQIHARKIVRRWFEGISAAVSRMPDLLGKAGNALKVGSDIAEPLADWWAKIEHEALKGAIQSVRSFGGALEDISAKLKERRALPTPLPPPVFQQRDPNVMRAEAQVERMLREGTEVPIELARIVERIDVRGRKDAPTTIARWQDIARLTSLQELRATNTDFELSEHGSYLADKAALVLLWLPPPRSDNLSPLGQLRSLTSLALYANQANDLSPIGQLTALKSLSLRVNSATDLNALGQLKHLNSLSVFANSATDLSALGQLKSLTSLSLHANSATSLGPIKELTALTSLSVYTNGVTEIVPLSGLPELTSLSIHAMKASRWDHILGSSKLTKLGMTRASTEGCDRLGQLTHLEDLYVDSSGSFDLGWLSSLKQLKKVRLKGVRVINSLALPGVEVIKYK